MTHNRRLVLLATCGIALGCGPIAANAAVPDTAPIQAAIHDAVQSKSVPGAIVLVRQNNRTVFINAEGDADGTPVKTDTVYWVASMTKPVVATTLMMLVEEGKVKLDDPVSKYIPEFAGPRMVRSLTPDSPPLPQVVLGGPPVIDPKAPQPKYSLAPANRALTVRDFVTMTAGLQTIAVFNKAMPQVTDEDTVATYVAKLGDVPLDFQPGSRWAYSNATEFEIVVRIVEVASGQHYADFVQSRVFDPLGMKDSNFGVRADLKDRTAPLGMMAHSPLRLGKFTSGSAGLWTTAEDYAHFAQMLLNGGTYEGKRLLKAATVRAMSRNEIGDLTLGGINPTEYGGLSSRSNAGVKYGYGLMVVTDPKTAGVALPAGSFGWDGVGSRRFWVDRPDKLVLVMLLPGGQAAKAQRAIEAATMHVFGGKH